MKPTTMIIDQGLGTNGYNDLLQHVEHFSAIKLAYGSSTLTDKNLLNYKLSTTPKNILLYPGGTLYEYYMKRGTINEYMDYLYEHNFKTVEVSNGCNYHSHAEKLMNIDRLKINDFTVISEVGSKTGELNSTECIKEIKEDLAIGADFITLEGRASGTAGIYDKHGDMSSASDALIKVTPRDRLIVEAPLKKQQVRLLKLYGKDVGLGNINPVDVLSVACLRKGLRGDTL